MAAASSAHGGSRRPAPEPGSRAVPFGTASPARPSAGQPLPSAFFCTEEPDLPVPSCGRVLLQNVWRPSSTRSRQRARPPHASTPAGPPDAQTGRTVLGQQAPARSHGNTGLKQLDKCQPQSPQDNPLSRYTVAPPPHPLFRFLLLFPGGASAAAQPAAASVLSRGRRSCQRQERGAPGAMSGQHGPTGSGKHRCRAQGGETWPPRAATLKSDKSANTAVASAAISAPVRPIEQAGSAELGISHALPPWTRRSRWHGADQDERVLQTLGCAERHRAPCPGWIQTSATLAEHRAAPNPPVAADAAPAPSAPMAELLPRRGVAGGAQPGAEPPEPRRKPLHGPPVLGGAGGTLTCKGRREQPQLCHQLGATSLLVLHGCHKPSASSRAASVHALHQPQRASVQALHLMVPH